MIASYTLYYVVRPTGGATAYSDLIQPTVPMPAVPAQPLDGGAPQVLRGLAGQWLLVVVDSGACAEACEQRLFMQRQLREMMGRERDRIDKVWLVTDDGPLAPALRAAVEAQPAHSEDDFQPWQHEPSAHADESTEVLAAAQVEASEIRGAEQREPAELLDEAVVKRAAGDGKHKGRRDIKNLLECVFH